VTAAQEPIRVDAQLQDIPHVHVNDIQIRNETDNDTTKGKLVH
jgi:hypothetical protein